MDSFIPNLDQPADDSLSLDKDPVTPGAAEEPEIEIEYVDSRPEDERQYEVNTVDSDKTRWTRDEKQKYGKNVRQRMGQMDYRVHQAERERDQAVRERQAMEEHFRSLQQQLQELKGREQKWGDVALDATKSRVEQEIQQVKSEITSLLQSPNPDAAKVVDAQERLSNLVSRREQVSQMVAAAPRNEPSPSAAPAGPPVHPNYQMDRERWLVTHPWFGKDLEKTQKLITIEQQLVTNGVIMGSRAYWDAIEKANNMLIGNGQGPANSRAGSPSSQTKSVVTGSSGARPAGTRVAAGNRTVVQLSQDERRAAARMQVSEQEWAKEKMKREEKLRAAGQL